MMLKALFLKNAMAVTLLGTLRGVLLLHFAEDCNKIQADCQEKRENQNHNSFGFYNRNMMKIVLTLINLSISIIEILLKYAVL